VNSHALQDPERGTFGHRSIRNVGIADPFRWIGAGIRDFRRAPGKSLLYGALFLAACLATYALTMSLPWFTLAFLTGLLLLGPYLATGLYFYSVTFKIMKDMHKQSRIQVRFAS
jgi:uncharacterized membrane protein